MILRWLTKAGVLSPYGYKTFYNQVLCPNGFMPMI